MNPVFNKYYFEKFNKICANCNKSFKHNIHKFNIFNKHNIICKYCFTNNDKNIINCSSHHNHNELLYFCFFCKKLFNKCFKCDSLLYLISIDNYQIDYDVYQYRTANLDKIITIIKKYPLLKKYINNNILEFNNHIPEIEYYINKFINQDLDFLYDLEINLKLNYDISDLKLNYFIIENIYLYNQMKINWKCLNC